MTRFLFTLLFLAALASAGMVFGAIYPNTFHPHAWLAPCSISKQFGATREDEPAFPDNLKWRVVAGNAVICENRRVELSGYSAPSADRAVARCEPEAQLGQEAADYLTRLFERSVWSVSGGTIRPKSGIGGLTEARGYIEDQPIAEVMIRNGFGRAIGPSGSDTNWCE